MLKAKLIVTPTVVATFGGTMWRSPMPTAVSTPSIPLTVQIATEESRTRRISPAVEHAELVADEGRPRAAADRSEDADQERRDQAETDRTRRSGAFRQRRRRRR